MDDVDEVARLRAISAEIGFSDPERLALLAHFEDPDQLVARLRET